MHGTICAAFLGASYATRWRKHLAIDALGRLLPERGRRVLIGISSAIGAIVAFALARGIAEALFEQWHEADERFKSMLQSGIKRPEVDRSYEFDFIIPVGFLLIGIRLLLHGFHELAFGIEGLKLPPSQGGGPEEGRPAPLPIDEAGPFEAGLGVVFALLPALLAWKTHIFPPILVGSLLAALSITLPLLLRYRKKGSLGAEFSHLSFPLPSLGALALSLLGVAAVLGGGIWASSNITHIPIGWGIAFFVLLALMGAPLFTFLGGLALFLWAHGTDAVPPTPLASAVEDVLGGHFAKMSVLPTIPIFTLAGYLMSESQTPKRLVRMARALLGWMPGGLAVVCVLASAGFTVFSGASGITIVAIGGLLFPALIKDRYP
ncbi:MAG: TRAP transporter large permease subunit, partial [Deltaproteobacteria bacterium]|nr:TRAP transporter large permease subunit [Deltaproteobacteria bacterium]